MASMRDYYPHCYQRLGAIWSLGSPPAPYSSYFADGEGNVTWRSADGREVYQTEHWRVFDGFVNCTGFSPGWGDGEPEYKARIIRAVMTDLETGASVELPAQAGIAHYYAPFLVPAGPWQIDNWFEIDGVKAFFRNVLTPGVVATNRFWYGADQTRTCIKEAASWWSDGEWVQATGTSPYDPEGRPIVPAVANTFWVTLARGIGVWTLRDEAANLDAGVYSIWPA